MGKAVLKRSSSLCMRNTRICHHFEHICIQFFHTLAADVHCRTSQYMCRLMLGSSGQETLGYGGTEKHMQMCHSAKQ